MRSKLSFFNLMLPFREPASVEIIDKQLPLNSIYSIWTWANLVTLIRSIVALVLFCLAFTFHSSTFNFLGLAVYWLLDLLDGFLARHFNQETRLGAQMDIISDRMLVSFFYLNYVILNPTTLLPVVLFLFEFCGLDLYLSNQFLRWPLVSPNYFYYVDMTIWRLNWSIPAKCFNTGVFTMLLVTLPSAMPALIFVIFLILVKIYSCVLLHRLRAPEVDYSL